MPEDYTSLAIKRQAMLERLKSGQVKDFVEEINKVDGLVRSAIGAAGDDVSALSRSKLEELIKGLRSDQGAIFKAATAKFLSSAEAIAILYAVQEVDDLLKTSSIVGTKLEKFSKKSLFSKVLARPLTVDGQLLKPWIARFTESAINDVSGTIRNGHALGQTNQQLVKRVIGTKGTNFRGSTLAKVRRNASTVVRTSIQHVASSARQEIWEANDDLIDKYQFLATLDSNTSRICRSLDLKEFELGNGPIPPLHPNCRSTTIPVLKEKYQFLNEGATRSAEGGPVDGKQNYHEWLKNQPRSVQDQVLGKKRSKLFQGMSAEKFNGLQYDKTWTPLTLKDMRKIEPGAFKKAGL